MLVDRFGCCRFVVWMLATTQLLAIRLLFLFWMLWMLSLRAPFLFWVLAIVVSKIIGFDLTFVTIQRGYPKV